MTKLELEVLRTSIENNIKMYNMLAKEVNVAQISIFVPGETETVETDVETSVDTEPKLKKNFERLMTAQTFLEKNGWEKLTNYEYMKGTRSATINIGIGTSGWDVKED